VTRDTVQALGLAVALAVLVTAVYSPVGGFGFLEYDDALYVTDQPRVQAGLTAETLRWAFTSLEIGNWHPLTWLSHAWTVEWFGLDAGAHHWVSVGLHAGVSALLLLTLFGATGSLPRSALVAALFALHPMRVESVAWIAERKDVLCGLFFFLAIAAHVAYVRRPSPSRYAAVLVAGLAALMSKAMAVTLPAVLLLLDVWPLARARPWSRLLLEKAPLVVLCAGASALALGAQDASGAVAPLEGWPVARRLSNAFVAYGAYLSSTLWPSQLAVFYPHPPDGHATARILASTVAVLALAGGALFALRRRPPIGVGLLWFLGTLVPVIGLVTVGEQAWADRYSYLPSVGLAIAFAWMLPEAVFSRWAGRGVLLVIVAAFALASWQGLFHWRSDETLFARALEVTRDSRVAHLNYGDAIEGQDRLAEQRLHFERAVALGPSHALGHYNLGRVLVELGEVENGIERYRTALALDPNSARTWNNLGTAWSRLDRVDEAEGAYRRALALIPDHPSALFNLAVLLLDRGDVAEGRALGERYLGLRPRDTASRTRLAGGLAERGQTDAALQLLDAAPDLDEDGLGLAAFLLWAQGSEAQALAAAEQALERAPDSVLHRKNLAWMLATAGDDRLRDPERARRLATEANDASSRRDPEVLDALAAAQAAGGDFDAALATLGTALERARELERPELVPVFEARRLSYRAGRPHRRGGRRTDPGE
jgi:tetratricopeptide (TPR) repeat protein